MEDNKELEGEFYTLTDEDGHEIQFEVIGSAVLNDKTYYAMVPTEDQPEDDEVCEYVILRADQDENGEDIVCADSMWTLMDMETKHPVRIEEEDAKGYEIRPRYPMERCGRKIRLPKEFEVVDTVVVPKADIDYNGHMSNAKYILLANEYLEDITRVSRIRVEYKSQARYRETLVIERAQLENKTDGGTETHVIVKMSGKEAGDVKAVVDYSIIEA